MYFRDDYEFLSNMYPSPIEVTIAGKKQTYSCVEAAFQAAKCAERMDEFVGIDGYQAKRLGRKVPLRPDWEAVKDRIMLQMVEAKFLQHPDLCKKLNQTPDIITEDNTWNDTYWGVCNGVGENHLGKILMAVRNEYRPFRCLVVGSREFEDYETLCKVLDKILQNYEDVEIVSGGAKGADSLAERYAKEHGYALKVFPANWNKYGKSAGWRRNTEMHKYISTFPNRGVIAFYNGTSKGTAHNFELAPKYENQLKIYNYIEKQFVPNPTVEEESISTQTLRR